MLHVEQLESRLLLNVDLTHAEALVPTAQATDKAIVSGPWDNPADWSNGVPGDNSRDWIPAGITESLDGTTARLQWLRVDGTLNTVAGTASKLLAETVVSSVGSDIEFGTPASPATLQYIRINLNDLNATTDPYAIGGGLIVGGKFGVYGSAVTPYQYTTGNVAGDTVVHLTAAETGWKAGDTLVEPGTGLNLNINDDDTSTIAAISGLTVTLTKPLQFSHEQGVVNGTTFTQTTGLASGWNRPAFVEDISARSVDFSSEVPGTIADRGFIMLCNNDNTIFQYASIEGFGRTDKTQPVTDPDGQGNGLANPRDRYAIDDQNNNITAGGPETVITGVIVNGSPGWGITVNNSSAEVENCAVNNCAGADYVAESGDEIGCFMNDVAVRSAASKTPDAANFAADRGNADWAFSGIGFWTQGGPFDISDDIATGMPSEPFVVMNLPFLGPLDKSPPISVLKSNLPAPYNTQAGVPNSVLPGDVPVDMVGLTAFGCDQAGTIWELNDNGPKPAVVAESTLSNCYLEANDGFIAGYLSHLTIANDILIRTAPNYSNSYGLNHSGNEANINFHDDKLLGFDIGITGPTDGLENQITNITFNCATDMTEWNVVRSPRAVSITNCTDSVSTMTAAEIASLAGGQHLYYGGSIQGNALCSVLMVANQAGSSIYSLPGFDSFWTQFAVSQGSYDSFLPDTVTLNGAQLFTPEESPSWKLSNAPSFPGFMQSLTNGQLETQYHMTVGGKILPSDVVPLSGAIALYSPSGALPTVFPRLVINNNPASNSDPNQPFYTRGQETNNPTGYVAQVQDAEGNFQYSAPTNLTDKSWNIVPVTADGYVRGVPVWCDSSISPAPAPPFPGNSNPPPSQTNNSHFVSQTIPTTVQHGQQFVCTVVMQNTGSATWIEPADHDHGYRLGSVNDNPTWGFTRVRLADGQTVAPGASVAFTFTATAPTTPGSYTMQFEMVLENVAWFGDMTPSLTITVT